MNLDDLKYFDRIEAYIDNNMTSEESVQFEKELTNNHDLSHEFELYKQIVNGIKEYHSDAIRKELRKADFELDAQLINSKKKRYIIYSIAASIALLLGISLLWWFNKSSKINYKEIAIQFRFEEKGLPVFMSGEGDVKFDDAMNFFKQKQYGSSLKILQELEKTKQGNDTISYYIGVNYELLDDIDKSIYYYENVLKIDNSSFKEKTEYRLALNYLGKGKIDMAKELLVKISKQVLHPYKLNALEVLKKIN